MNVDATKRYTAGRVLQCKAVGRGDARSELAHCSSQNWLDRYPVEQYLKAAVSAVGESDFAGTYQPVAEAFLSAMRPFSVPMRLANMRRVPMLTRVLKNDGRILASEVDAGAPIPVAKMTLADATLTPRHFAAITVKTEELMHSTSPLAALEIETDLAEAVAEVENTKFVSPLESGSVLYGAPNFAASGTTAAAIATDLQQLLELVNGAYRPGAAFVMSMETATYIGTTAGEKFPNIGPQGGTLLGLPVIVTPAMSDDTSPVTRMLGLVDPNEILWADDGQVQLSASGETAIQLLDNPTNTSSGSTTATTLVSMFETRTVALKAVRTSAWYARSGAGAYLTTAY